eukprot:4751857-Amphidinium_carterae.2
MITWLFNRKGKLWVALIHYASDACHATVPMQCTSGWEDEISEYLGGWDMELATYCDETEEDAILPPMAADAAAESVEEVTTHNHLVQVPSDTMAALSALPSFVNVCPLRSVFDEVLSHVDCVASMQSDRRDPEVRRVADFYWGQEQHLHTSKIAAAQLMQVDSSNVAPLLGLLTNTMIHVDWQKKAGLGCQF